MKSLVLASSLLALALSACTSGPDLHEMSCTPPRLSASAIGPVTLYCSVTFDGMPGDARFSAHASDGSLWAAGSGFMDMLDREAGEWVFMLRNANPPPAGQLTITLGVDDVEGIDGPAGDEITRPLTVTP